MHLYEFLLAYIAIFASVFLPVQAFNIRFYQGKSCRNFSLGNWIGGPDQGCQTEFSGNSQSVIVKSTGPVDDPFYVVFFSSKDCNPSTRILHTDQDKCKDVQFGSYEVWNVDV